jgi:hypothetical protein
MLNLDTDIDQTIPINYFMKYYAYINSYENQDDAKFIAQVWQF